MTQESGVDAATSVFVGHRELLFSVVYNLLGSVADTEDVLQETWVSWSRRHAQSSVIENPRAYLVRIAVNEALARQASITRRRESYVGPWLPEPLLTDSADSAEEDPAVRSESVSMALLVVLETLTPLERAVFVLHEIFGYAHTEIADILERSPSAVRQLAHRARSHVHARRPRYQADPRVQRQVTERFVSAAFGGDIGALMEILAPDVTMWTDSGSKGLRPIQGRSKVARLISNVTAKLPSDLVVRYRTVNGDPSAVIFSDDSPFAVMVLDLDPEDDRVRGIYGVTNPDKLSGLG
jgi:RNA polymerase sigma-70 factor (ECF subfamily)